MKMKLESILGPMKMRLPLHGRSQSRWLGWMLGESSLSSGGQQPCSAEHRMPAEKRVTFWSGLAEEPSQSMRRMRLQTRVYRFLCCWDFCSNSSKVHSRGGDAGSHSLCKDKRCNFHFIKICDLATGKSTISMKNADDTVKEGNGLVKNTFQ